MIHYDPKKRKFQRPKEPGVEYVKNPGPPVPFKKMTGKDYMKYCDDRGV